MDTTNAAPRARPPKSRHFQTVDSRLLSSGLLSLAKLEGMGPIDDSKTAAMARFLIQSRGGALTLYQSTFRKGRTFYGLTSLGLYVGMFGEFRVGFKDITGIRHLRAPGRPQICQRCFLIIATVPGWRRPHPSAGSRLTPH